MFMTFLTKTRMAALSVALLSIATAAAPAQSTTQGAISGTVFDSTGAVISSAKVTIHNNATNAETLVSSDQSGNFNAPLVEPGTYTVTIAAPGFGDVTEKDVLVQVGQATTLEPHMSTGSTAETVTISADAATLNFENPDLSSELPGTAIEEIPVQNRRWSALALTTPNVVADASGFGLVSVHGSSTVQNDVLIDGADDNQAYFSEERGRTREGYSTSESAVREFQVNTGVYSAEFGRSIGTVINSVTKSGSNELHGEAFFQDLDRGFGAYDPGSVNPAGAPLKPKDLRKIYGFSVGGAILKDKLFWFYTYNQLAHVNPGISKAAQYGSTSSVGTFLEQPDPAVTTCTENATTGAVTVTGAVNHSNLDTQVCALLSVRT